MKKRTKTIEMVSDQDRDKRQIFFLIGLCIALSMSLVAFEWKGSSNEDIAWDAPTAAEDLDFMVNLIHTERPKTEAVSTPEPTAKPPIRFIVNPDPIPTPDPKVVVLKGDFEEQWSLPAVPAEIVTEPDPPTPPQPVDFFTKAPEFPGGLSAFYEYMGKNVKYSTYLREIGVEGIVFVSFVVNLDGTVTEVNLLRGVHPNLDEQVVNALKKSPSWSPGFQGRHAVPVRYKDPSALRWKTERSRKLAMQGHDAGLAARQPNPESGLQFPDGKRFIDRFRFMDSPPRKGRVFLLGLVDRIHGLGNDSSASRPVGSLQRLTSAGPKTCPERLMHQLYRNPDQDRLS